MLFACLNNGERILVNRDGLFPSVLCLLLMLISTVTVIKLNHWVMSKTMGYAMFFLYFCFMAQGVITQVIAENNA